MSTHLDYRCTDCQEKTELWGPDYRPSLYTSAFERALKHREAIASLVDDMESDFDLHTVIFNEAFSEVAAFFKAHEGHVVVVVDGYGHEYRDGQCIEGPAE